MEGYIRKAVWASNRRKTCSDIKSNYGFLSFLCNLWSRKKTLTDEEKNGIKDKSEENTDNIGCFGRNARRSSKCNEEEAQNIPII